MASWVVGGAAHAANIAAAAYVLETDPVKVKGYAVVGVSGDGKVIVATNRCCLLHVADTLAMAISCIVSGEICGPEAIT